MYIGKQTMHSMPGYGEFFLPSFLSQKHVHRWQVGVLEIVCLLAYNSFIILGLFRAGKPQGMGAPKSMWCIWPVVVGGTWWISWFWNAVSTVEGKRLAPWWPKWRNIIKKTWRFLTGEDESTCFEWMLLDGKIAFSRLLEGLVVQSLGLPGLSLGFPSWMDDENIHISDPWDERYTYVEPTNWRQI